MKKYLIALVLGLVSILVLVPTIVQADNGPHGGFSANTDTCAVCHRLHSSKGGTNDLIFSDPQALCLACHSGSGANTNVVDGVFMGTGSELDVEGAALGSLLGGGFTNALMATTWSGKAAFDPGFNATSSVTTSMHDMGADQKVWGAGTNNAADATITLECISCHDPHGNAGWDVTTTPGTATRVASYRLLRWQPSGSDGFTPPVTRVNWTGGAYHGNLQTDGKTGWLVPDNYSGKEWYTIGTKGRSALGDYTIGNITANYQPAGFNYVPAAANMAYFCAQCHDRYFNNNKLFREDDESLYCGTPGDPRRVGSAVIPTVPVNARGLNSQDPINCLPVYNSSGELTGWADDRPSGDPTYMYRHDSGDVIRNSNDGTFEGSHTVTTSVGRSCVACHVAHGTSANPDADTTDAIITGSKPGSGSLAGGSVLLRMDGRTICLSCHLGDVDFTVGPLAEKSHNDFSVLTGSQCAKCHSIHSARQ